MPNVSLPRLIQKLPEPVNYYAGLSTESLVQPQSIVLFPRLGDFDPTECVHHRFVLSLVVETGATMIVDNQRLHLRASQALLMFPYQPHRVETILAPNRCWLNVSFELVDPAQEAVLAPLRGRPVDWSPAIESLAQDLLAARSKGQTRLQGAILTLRLSEILESLRAMAMVNLTAPRLPGSHSAEIVRHVAELLTREPAAIVQTVGDVAARLSMSESHLRRVFREQSGRSLGRYLREYRVYQAVALMSTTPMLLADVAERCGFSSLQAFSRTFRSVIGESPMRHRTRISSGLSND